jgi:chorismate-pyruvate lyase
MTSTLRRSWNCAGTLLWCAAAAADAAPAPAPAWPDTFVARLEALTLLETLNSELLSHDSATATLEHWCEAHTLASPASIVADRIAAGDDPPSSEQRRELAVTAGEPVRHRRVRLRCGSLVLSEADNWYVPSRLTPEMNRVLDTTDVPFGRAVQALHFQRHTQSSTLLWSPLPEGWETHSAADRGSAELAIPPRVIQHRAMLALEDGTPFSEVEETYTSNVLAFPPPPDRRPAPQPGGERLVGAWRLVAIDYRGPHGETIDPFYQDGSSGLIVYDSSGWMSVQIGAPRRRGPQIPAVRVPEDRGSGRLTAQAFDTYYSYYGTWDYDAATSTVTHHLESSLIPAEAGMSYAQTAALEGGRLVLTVRAGDPGRETVRRKVWERVAPAPSQP